MRFILYGASGFTGQLLAEEAVRRGHRPLLAGRNAAKLEAVATRLGLEWRAVSLDDAEGLRRLVQGAGAVLNAAGPFSATFEPMVEACLDVGTSYLDISGELQSFEQLFTRDARAKRRGIALIAGVGFDVVPSDCLAAQVAQRVPGADTLLIALSVTSGAAQPSPGSLKALFEVVSNGGRVRRDGRLVPLALGRGSTRVPWPYGMGWCIPMPIADLASAFRATGIPNITVCFGVPASSGLAARWLWPLGAVVRLALRCALKQPAIKRQLHRWIDARVQGAAEPLRANNRAYIYARASASDGRFAERWLSTEDGYSLTAQSGVLAVEHVLADRPVGALTPAQAFGVDYAFRLQGVSPDPTATRSQAPG